MQQYIGIISKNEEGRPLVCNQDDYIRVRVPAIHGPQPTMALTGSKAMLSDRILDDNLLPWALLSRSFENKNFSATELQEGDLVYVIFENDDTTSPIITGYASRYSYTDDMSVANANLLYGGSGATVSYEKYSKADDLVAIAKSQVGKTENNTNNIVYNSDFEGREVNGSQFDWNVVFVWWCFKQIGASSEFYSGNKTRVLSDVISFYQKSGRYIQKGQSSYLAGDLVIVNAADSSGTRQQYIAIVSEDQVDNTVSIIIGDYNGKVCELKAELNSISGGIKLGNQIISNTYSGNSRESQIFNLVCQLAGYNTAAGVAVITNLWCENHNFDPSLSCKDTDNKIHHGLCMWGPERWKELINFCKQNNFDKNSIDGQVNFMINELSTKYSGVDSYLRNLPNTKEGAGDGAAYWAEHFEVCARKFWEERRKYAEDNFWPLYSGSLSGNYANSPNGFILPLQYDNVVATGWWGSYKNHRGIDFITSGATGNTFGKQIVASKDGIVAAVEKSWSGGTTGISSYGNYVLINHDGVFSSRYAHCNSVLVNRGDTVKQGQKIATVGNSGNVSPMPTSANPTQGAHVHFEILKNRERVDPASYLPSFKNKNGQILGNASISNSRKPSASKVAARKNITKLYTSNIDFATDKANSYSITVNVKQQLVYIYDSSKTLVKTCICSTGPINKTELGSFKIGSQNGKPVKYVWHKLNANYWVRYATRFNGNLLFHSVPYTSNSTNSLDYNIYSNLGRVGKSGCVILCVSDAKWIYDNCTDGTVVHIIDSDDIIKCTNQTDLRLDLFNKSSIEYRGWDPTDLDINNPWTNL